MSNHHANTLQLEPGSNLSQMLKQLSQEQEVLTEAVASRQERLVKLENQISHKQLGLDEVKLEVTRHRQNMMIIRESINQKKKQMMMLVGEFHDPDYAECKSDIVLGISQKSEQLAQIKDKNVKLEFVFEQIDNEREVILNMILKSKEVAEQAEKYSGIQKEYLRVVDTLKDIKEKINILENNFKGINKKEHEKDIEKKIEYKEKDVVRANVDINALSLVIQERKEMIQKIKNDILITQKRSRAQIKRLKNILTDLKKSTLPIQ